MGRPKGPARGKRLGGFRAARPQESGSEAPGRTGPLKRSATENSKPLSQDGPQRAGRAWGWAGDCSLPTGCRHATREPPGQEMPAEPLTGNCGPAAPGPV